MILSNSLGAWVYDSRLNRIQIHKLLECEEQTDLEGSNIICRCYFIHGKYIKNIVSSWYKITLNGEPITTLVFLT